MAYYKKYRAIRKEVNEWLNTSSETLHKPSHSVMEDDEMSEMSAGDEMEVSEAQLPSDDTCSPVHDDDYQPSKRSYTSQDSHDLTEQCCSDDEIAEIATRGSSLFTAQ